MKQNLANAYLTIGLRKNIGLVIQLLNLQLKDSLENSKL